jgi:hypothetical protein
MADYCLISDVRSRLLGQWGPDVNMGGGQSRDQFLGTLITACSRRFDRETGRPTNYWAPGTGISRNYPGSGGQYQDIDDWLLVTGVTMSTKQDRSDAVTLVTTYDPNNVGNYVVVLPTNGPPFNQLFMLRGFLPDVYAINNITVTGNVETPADITDAVAIWAAYSYQRARAGWQDRVVTAQGPSTPYAGTLPPEVEQVLAYYRDNRRGPKLALEDGTDRQRVSRWLGWVAR